MPKKNEAGQKILLCAKCGFEKPIDKDIKLTSKVKESERTRTVVISEKEKEEATEDIECPECGKIQKVVQWQVQTRSADEAMTTFYKCTVCNNTWRDYGG